MKHIVIDLEMCQVPKSVSKEIYKPRNEIIEIGAVMLDEGYNQISSFKSYVRPLYGVLTLNISRLTGIVNEDIHNAPILEEALIDMINWISDIEVDIYAWSENDWLQLNREIKHKAIDNDKINSIINETNWIDYQQVFGEKFGYPRKVSLIDALALTHVFLEGRQHDGLVDAINTARLIETIESHPNYKLPESYSVGEKGENVKFGTYLGDLLNQFSLSVAS